MIVEVIGGEGRYGADQKVSKLVASFKKKFPSASIETHYADELSNFNELGSLAGSMGLFSQAKIVILKDAFGGASANVRDQLLELLKSATLETSTGKSEADDTLVILHERGKFDKRSKLYKFAKKELRLDEFNAPKPAELTKFWRSELQRQGLTATGKVSTLLQEKLGTLDEYAILNEISKLKLLLEAEFRTTIEPADLNLLNQELEVEVWELFNLARINKHQANELLRKLLQQQIPPPVIVGFLASQLRQILEYKLGQKQAPFIARRARTLASNYDDRKLGKLIERLLSLDVTLKSSSFDAHLGLSLFLAVI